MYVLYQLLLSFLIILFHFQSGIHVRICLQLLCDLFLSFSFGFQCQRSIGHKQFNILKRLDNVHHSALSCFEGDELFS